MAETTETRVRAEAYRVSVRVEMGDLRTCLDQSVEVSTVLSNENVGMVEEVRLLSAEHTQFMAEMAEESKRVEADRVSVRTKIYVLRQELSKRARLARFLSPFGTSSVWPI